MDVSEIRQELSSIQKEFERVAKKNTFSRFEGFFMSEKDRNSQSSTADVARNNAYKIRDITAAFERNETRGAQELITFKNIFDDETNKKIDNIIENFPQSIKDHFNDLREKEQAKKEFDESFKALQETVKSNDVLKSQAQFEKIKNSSLFGAFEKDRLIEQSMLLDNIAMLSVFHDIKKDPNYTIKTNAYDKLLQSSMFRGPRSFTFSPILYSAITYKAEKIALALALNKKTDIDIEYHRASARMGSDGMYKPVFTDESVFDAAKKSDMTLVTAAITKRVAKNLQAEAKALLKTIKPA